MACNNYPPSNILAPISYKPTKRVIKIKNEKDISFERSKDGVEFYLKRKNRYYFRSNMSDVFIIEMNKSISLDKGDSYMIHIDN